MSLFVLTSLCISTPVSIICRHSWPQPQGCGVILVWLVVGECRGINVCLNELASHPECTSLNAMCFLGYRVQLLLL